jgi:hypothetical protein
MNRTFMAIAVLLCIVDAAVLLIGLADLRERMAASYAAATFVSAVSMPCHASAAPYQMLALAR